MSSPEELQTPTPEKQPTILEAPEKNSGEKLEMLDEALEERTGLSGDLNHALREQVYKQDPLACKELLRRSAAVGPGLVIRSVISSVFRHGEPSEYLGFHLDQPYDTRKAENDKKTAATAGKMYEEDMKRIETEGGNFIKLKIEFAEHKRDQTSAESLIQSISDETERANLQEKLQNETAEREALIAEKNSDLQEQLDFYRKPLEQEQTQLNEMMSQHNETLKSINSEEENLKKAINQTGKDIINAEKLKLLGDVGKELVAKLKAQQEEAQQHLAAFAERKAMVSKRLDEMKTNKIEIDGALDRINKIGKSEVELKKEKQEQKSAKQKTVTPQKKVTHGVIAGGAPTKTAENAGATAAETGEEPEEVEETNNTQTVETGAATKPKTEEKTPADNVVSINQGNETVAAESGTEQNETLKQSVIEWIKMFEPQKLRQNEWAPYFKTKDGQPLRLGAEISTADAIHCLTKYLTENKSQYRDRPEAAQQYVVNRIEELKKKAA
jgi:hypothetical protein